MVRGSNITASGKANEKSSLHVRSVDGLRDVGGSTAVAITERCTMACSVYRNTSRHGVSHGDAQSQGCPNADVYPAADLCTGDGTTKCVEGYAIANAVASTGILDCAKSNP